MRNPALNVILTCLFVIGAGLACGGCAPITWPWDDDESPPEVTWSPSDRLPASASHWWWEAVERSCDEDSDCPSAERCQNMRLGTCPGCPRGEDHEICIPRTAGGATASGR